MLKYTAFVKQKVRKVIAYRDLDVDSAIRFLKENKFGVIEEADGTALTIEELKYVKSLGSNPRVEPDSFVTSEEEVPEDPDRELFRFTPNNSESSTDSDN